MATESRPLINQELLLQVEQAARAQNREPFDLIEAVGKYLASQRLASFAEKMQRRLTNILASALGYRRGKPYEFLQRALAGDFNLTVSLHIFDELADVLVRKFDAAPKEVADALDIVSAAARTVTPAVVLDVIAHSTDCEGGRLPRMGEIRPRATSA